jgi:hypothetical protein
MKLFPSAQIAQRFWLSLFFFLFSAVLVAAVGAPRVAASPPPQSAARGEEMDLATYLSELDRVSSAVATLDKHLEEIQPLRQSLPKSWTVRAAGQRFEVPLGWLDSALATLETTPVVRASLQKDIQNCLRVFREQAEAMSQAESGPPVEAARTRLANILGRREFRSVRGPSWWDLARQRFWAGLWRLFRKLFGRIGGYPRAGEILVWCMIAAAFVALALWLRSRLRRAAHAEGLDLKDAGPAGETWRDWAQRALAAAAQNDYRKAVHAAYWAGVYRLAELGAWRLDLSRTPREYMRLLAQRAPGAEVDSSAVAAILPLDHASRAEALRRLTLSLEITWYGFQPATAADFREAVVQLEALGCRFPSSLATAGS